jgi:hypothetical protein
VNLLDRLLESDEPSVRLQVRLGIDNAKRDRGQRHAGAGMPITAGRHAAV